MQAHHFQWRMGGQSLRIRNGYYQGKTQHDRDLSDEILTDWLEQAETSGEPTLVAGDFTATRAELTSSRWFEAVGWYELGGAQQPATCWAGSWRAAV